MKIAPEVAADAPSGFAFVMMVRNKFPKLF